MSPVWQSGPDTDNKKKRGEKSIKSSCLLVSAALPSILGIPVIRSGERTELGTVASLWFELVGEVPVKVVYRGLR